MAPRVSKAAMLGGPLDGEVLRFWGPPPLTYLHPQVAQRPELTPAPKPMGPRVREHVYELEVYRVAGERAYYYRHKGTKDG